MADISSNPLQSASRLYKVNELILMATPLNATEVQYNRLSFSASEGNRIAVKTNEQIEMGASTTIICTKSVTNILTSRQEVIVVNTSGIDVIKWEDTKSVKTSYPFDKTSEVKSILDMDPVTGGSVYFACADPTGPYILNVIFPSKLSDPLSTSVFRLPSQIPPALIKADFIRYRNDTYLNLAALDPDGTTFSVYALKLTDLVGNGAENAPSAKTISCSAGNINPALPVDAVVAGLFSNGSEQYAIVYGNQHNACQISIVSPVFTATDTTTPPALSVTTLSPDLSFAAPAGSRFRLTVGDLLNNGNEQLVLGYTGVYGGFAGCACIQLYDYDKSKGTVVFNSAAAFCGNDGTQNTPFCTIDLTISAGVFGEDGTLGIMLVGAASSMKQLLLNEASIMTGFVGLDANSKHLPTNAGSVPIVIPSVTSIMVVNASTTKFTAVAADLPGLSIMLGPPTYSERKNTSQILAIIQTIPFQNDDKITSSEPNLNINSMKSTTNTLVVNSNKVWTFSNGTNESLGVGAVTLGQNMTNTYGKGFDKMSDDMVTKTVQLDFTMTYDDLIITMATNYHIWEYPVIKSSAKDSKPSSLLVIYPDGSPTQDHLLGTDSDLGYIANYEIGKLLSYINIDKPGYVDNDSANTLFNPGSMSASKNTASMAYTQDEVNTKAITNNNTVEQGLEDSAHLAYSTELFEYLPVNFGLNLTSSSHYSDTEITTTTTMNNTMLTVTFNNTVLTNDDYSYYITPYVYLHKDMGCLMVAYDVSVSGGGVYWGSKEFNSTHGPVVIRANPGAQDLLTAAYSRKISFVENKDGTVTVQIEVFNEALIPAANIIVNVYNGLPVVDNSSHKLSVPGAGADGIPNQDLIGSYPINSMNPLARSVVMVPNRKLVEKDCITVELINPSTKTSLIYWNIYPAGAYASLNSSSAGKTSHMQQK